MAEKEYIEREAIEKAFAEEIRTNYLDDYAKGFQAALLAVMSIPAADVVEVVRCKDCKYFRTKPNYCSVLASDNINKDFYCESGERKEYDNDT